MLDGVHVLNTAFVRLCSSRKLLHAAGAADFGKYHVRGWSALSSSTFLDSSSGLTSCALLSSVSDYGDFR
jgi:hypothetical protein